MKKTGEILERQETEFTLEELKEENQFLYRELFPESYLYSYGNPAYAEKCLGEYGKAMSFLYAELRGSIVYAYEKKWWDYTVAAELFLEVHSAFSEEELPSVKTTEDILRSYVNDYCQDMMEQRIAEGVDPSLDFAVRIIMDSDLTDLRYLYKYGEYVSENETGVAEFLNSLTQEQIDDMARTYTEGYRIGFINTRKDIAKKKTVNIRYNLGFERMVRAAILQFREMGLEPVIYRHASHIVNKRGSARVGFTGGVANPQYEYDHRQDSALFLDSDFVKRKLRSMQTAYEKYKDLAGVHGGPAVIETFGEEPFSPIARSEAYSLSDAQQKLQVELDNESGQIVNRYIKGEERSFTIIAYPVPEIGEKFPEIFGEIVKINTLDYKLYQLNLNDFSRRVNERFRKNGGKEQIFYSMNRDIEKMLSVTAEVYDEKQKKYKSINSLGKGMRSIYMLSLLETCEETMDDATDLIIVENPEIFLHPKLQNESGDILYRLSKKSQVIFSTHAANLLSNFNSRQIRQMVQGEDGYARISEKTDISEVLDNLGYSAGDLMNVNFVFIVEGRQDKSRLPLLLKKYYSEMYDENGNLQRIAIITTNSCTNIKTYANLKYMNQIYLKDNFLMIRDGDGRDREMLKHQLCKYYEERNQEDVDRLPRVMPKNVLILKYYSFENYFLNPAVMAQLGIVDSEQEFYETFLAKWKEYLHRISSGKKLTEVLGKDLETTEDVKNHMEEIKIYLRGHNLYDIFYGRYKKEETELLTRYIELAPREDFADILDSIERFIYFESRKN